MVSILQKMSVIAKIGTACIILLLLICIYKISTDKYIEHAIEKSSEIYTQQKEILLRKLPQDASGVFFVTQQEVDGIKKDVSTIINPIEVDSLSTNKDYTLGFSHYCYKTETKEALNKEKFEKINTLCKEKNIDPNRRDTSIIRTLQSLWDIKIHYVEKTEQVWKVFPFIDKINMWVVGDYFTLAVILFIIVGIWEMLRFIYSQKKD